MKLFIAVPSHTGQICADTSQAIANNMAILCKCGIDCYYDVELGEAYVPRARNSLVKRFLNSDCDAIVFIDYDVAFRKDAIIDLVISDKDIVGGTYPKKKDETDFPIQVSVPKVEVDGLLKVDLLPSGFIMIKRCVFEKMKAKIPIRTDSDLNMDWYYDTGFLFENDNRWWGEDPAFCRRCAMANIDMWCYTDITFSHTGPRIKIANYDQWSKEKLAINNISSCITRYIETLEEDGK